jgi:DNA-binding XRE family transcriptional regulator
MLRINAGLSRNALGKIVGVHHSTIGKLEDDGDLPSERVAFAIAQHFGKEPLDIWPELAEGAPK